ncbi:MAG: serine--tRNA ligase [Candidatus Berkelbacteria bacterium]|nr:MAG: serine--tRNA ligase [Candidatus Berkelbacteria bacterium]QQG51870.1 MAG: serine--tRNA ligase [Candidatus Berkelbacteria bacterium]
MLDPEILRTKPELVKASITKRGGNPELVDAFLELDRSWKAALQEAEQLRQERNQLTASKELAQKNSAKLKKLKEKLQKLESKEREVAERRLDALSLVPQILSDEVPVGEGESANIAIRNVGRVRLQTGKTHDELMEALGWLDSATAARTSGARFRFLKRDAALAHMKLMNLALNWAVRNGFTPVIPPVLVRDDLLLKTGFFPVGREDTFKVEEHFLTGTSEPLLVALGSEQTHPVDKLPLRFTGFSTCFRREAGSYGKDTKGMFRQHQFDKVEMVSICRPEESEKEHQRLVSLQEKFVSQFDVPYQMVLVGSGDLETKATKRYDLESYFPGQARYRETHSASNCGDYQARSFNIKVRDKDGEEVYAHTLNATLATERLLLAIIENHQRPDGRIDLPRALRS